MELWIRSQDKESLRKINAFHIGETNDKRISIIDDDYNTIAFYNSKERALEVLNKISKLVENAMYHTQLNNEVLFYQMPEE